MGKNTLTGVRSMSSTYPFRLHYCVVHRGSNFSGFLSLVIYDLFNFNFGYHSRMKGKIYEKRKKVLAA